MPAKLAYRGPANTCHKNTDCPNTAVCHPELKRCVIAGVAANAKYHVVVYPNSDPVVLEKTTSNPPQGFDVVLDADGAASEELDVYFPVPVVLTINYKSGDTNQSVEFVTRIIMTETGNSGPEFARLIYDFRITSEQRINFPRRYFLPKDGTYQIKVIPEDSAGRYPVHYFRKVSVDPRGKLSIGDSGSNEINVYKEDNKVTGTLLMDGFPANGFTVQAIDPDTARIASPEVVSKCTLENDGSTTCGRFTFSLSAELETFNLVVSRPDIPGYPKVTKHGIPQSNPVVELKNPGPPVRFRARIERPPYTAESATNYFDGLPDCSVYFRSSNIPEGTALQYARTDEKGDLVDTQGLTGINLYAGSYRMTVVPPNRLGMVTYDYSVLNWTDPINVSGTGEMSRQVYTLERRPFIQGTLWGSDSEVTAGIIRAEPLGQANSLLRASTGKVASDGSYSLWVDRGNYRFTAEAPFESGYAWAITTKEIQDDSQLDIDLNIPFVATLKLRSADARHGRIHNFENVLVEWYEMISGDPVPVGRSVADKDGKVIALLPPPGSQNSR